VSSFIFAGFFAPAQNGDAAPNFTLPLLIVVGAILAVWALLTLADNLMQIEAKKVGLDTRNKNFGIIPSMPGFKSKAPDFASESNFHALTKGADIKLEGDAPLSLIDANVKTYALQPNLYNVMSPIPKVNIEVGGEVKAGEPLFFDKKRPEIKYVSPVSGEIVEVIRGEKRAIHKIVVLADNEINYKKFNVPSLDADRASIVEFMLESGAWSLLNARPFDMVPEIDSVPRDIFISTFNTAPLAPNINFITSGQDANFQKGCDVLNTLTNGAVYLGLDGSSESASGFFSNIENVEKHYFTGKHPAGNVGVQIHHIKSIRAGESVWTLNVDDVITIGKLFNEGKYDASKMVALTGNRLSQNGYVKTYVGANLTELLEGNITDAENTRVVAGDVLSGRQVEKGGYLGHNENHISTLKEGNQYELFGWLLPITPRPSLSGTFPNALLYKNHKFDANTNTHGEKRAFVVSGQYEAVLPMDIYPQHLMKAILANDFERMEGLGIYELSPEDIALCEFACTSKMPIQSILKEGLETMRSQM
jgi:Na+-transporting NADH:ubiquinone oxidoreductase subunit A